MAATLTATTSRKPKGIFEIILDWVSHTDGAVALDIATALGWTANSPIVGRLHWVETIPGLNGDKATECPDPNYAITLVDSYGLDVMDSVLLNRSASAAERVMAVYPMPLADKLTLTIASAGSGKKGRLILALTTES